MNFFTLKRQGVSRRLQIGHCEMRIAKWTEFCQFAICNVQFAICNLRMCPCCALLRVALIIFAVVTAASAQEPAIDGAFAPAVEYTQARTVKIFGAGIGRSPGYATGLIVSPQGEILTTQGVFLAGENLRVTL